MKILDDPEWFDEGWDDLSMKADLTLRVAAPLGPMLCEMAARTGTPVEEWVEWAMWVRFQNRRDKWVS